MDTRSGEHDSTWGPLAVGHALSALEPEDDAAFVAHLRGCEQCRRTVAETSEVMGQLAHDVPPAEPPASLRSSILAAIPEDGPAPEPIASQPPRPARPARAPRSLARWSREAPLRMAVAASVLLLAVIAAGVWTLVVQNGRSPQPTVAERCAALHCPTATMTDASGRTAGEVMALDGQAYVTTTDMPAPGRGQWYVLWRIGSDHKPVAVGGFRTGHGGAVVSAGALGPVVSTGDSFAVSRERADVVPATPSVVVASGAVSA